METSGFSCEVAAARDAEDEAEGAESGGEAGWSAPWANVGADSAVESSNKDVSRRVIIFRSPEDSNLVKRGAAVAGCPPSD